MELERIEAVYFSATGVTGKVVRVLAEALAEELSLPLTCRSFTRLPEREGTLQFGPEDLVIVGTPTYAGRVPNKLLPDLETKLRGGGALAVPVVTFGERAFDNSLAELCAVLDASRRLGITVGESLLMNPCKSVTAVIGIADAPQPARVRGCGYCTMRETCELRKRGKTCGP